MKIAHAKTDDDYRNCFKVLKILRPQLENEEALIQWMRKVEPEGYRLAYLQDDAKVVRAVAGYRVQHMISRGKHIYIDDLSTDDSVRSKGYGKALFNWLLEVAREEDCQQLELDSGVKRHRAHKFYLRENMHIASYHFSIELKKA